MGFLTGKLQLEERLSVAFEGVHLEIIASSVAVDAPGASRVASPASWQLAIENADGVRSVWNHRFVSAAAAIDAGVRAIETEGVRAFTRIRDFRYQIE